MRKRLIGAQQPSSMDGKWLDLESIADVEITSEDDAHPIEAALQPGAESGWRAARGGEQVIRLLFHTPQPLKRVLLQFVETDLERTQEFVLRWSPDQGASFRDIARQQWNFSPSGSTNEREEYSVNAPGATVLELRIVPDKSGGSARASLAELRVA